ncbi:cadherin-related family member 2 [Erpetoichthys calabaricus]|uniref:cadherin-related family member 2 n=1 Tax=Erpetoichthys calabaricus TaxID=27687 RepID=UPI002234D068|nr:cadherin-related family member 2 [Erpetoichthys calabaricus]
MKYALVLLPLFCLADAQSAPNFCSNMTYVLLCENLEIGDKAFQICATNPDNNPLIYGITGENSHYFNVNSSTGYVTIKSYLNRENMGNFDVTLSITDQIHDPITKQFTIIVNDANDNPPIFNGVPYIKDVLEDVSNWTEIFRVNVTDLDLPSPIYLSITEVIPDDSKNRGLFAIQNNGSVRLNGALDYNSKGPNYRLKIFAEDSSVSSCHPPKALNATTFLVINVEDVRNLDPVFYNTPYLTSVEENTPEGTSVFQVHAVDGDKGINDEIFFSINESNWNGLFRIDESSGIIYVNGSIDREELLDIKTVVKLKIKAEENHPSVSGMPGQAFTYVNITITDINDNKPIFYSCLSVISCNFSQEENTFVGEIEEHSVSGISVKNLTIVARDLDKDENAIFKLELQGPDADAFSVRPSEVSGSSQVDIVAKNQNAIDYEENTVMFVQIIASDPKSTGDCCSTATVTIHVLDMNDNIPTFANDTYTLYVKEHSDNNTVIAVITATDPDTADQGKLTYRLEPKSITKYFDVNQATGVIFVKNKELLDREKFPDFIATLQAIDTSNKIGSTAIELILEDINDNYPRISRDQYTPFVKEGPGEHVEIKIEATDRDDPNTNNSVIRYGIIPSDYSSNFSIDPITGFLTNNGTLYRENINPALNGTIHLNVSACDLGVPSLCSFVSVVINVEDINNNDPVFFADLYNFTVPESEPGAYVGIVRAQDPDQTEINNRISFSFSRGNVGKFIIKTSKAKDNQGYTGNISVAQDVSLDYEEQKEIILSVIASDGERTAEATVNIIVTDVNDEPPKLDATTLQDVSVKENKSTLGIVREIIGTDKDTNHSLVYQMVSTAQCKCNVGVNDTVCRDWFYLNPNGSVIVNESSVIDYEECHQVIMKVKVVDILTEKGVNHSETGTLIINIQDINDNAPVITVKDNVFVVVPEAAKKDDLVTSLFAKDRDSGVNKIIEFEIPKIEFISTDGNTLPKIGSFSVRTTVDNNIYEGSVRIATTLDSELKGKYRLTIIAKDMGEPSLSSTAEIEIFTVDTSYRVGLEFTTPVEEVEKNFNSIKAALNTATQASVHVVDIFPKDQTQRNKIQSVMEAYFVYLNGTAISPNNVISILQSDQAAFIELGQYGLWYISVLGTTAPPENQIYFFVIAGLVVFCIVIFSIMVTALVCTRKSFKRKLKASDALRSAVLITPGNLQTGPVVPGTNQYTMDGANPVLNMKFDTPADLGFDEENSSSDRASFSSLDLNVDMEMTDKDTAPMMIIQEEDEECNIKEPHYIEPLSAALAQHKNKEPETTMQFINPTLDTTDL